MLSKIKGFFNTIKQLNEEAKRQILLKAIHMKRQQLLKRLVDGEDGEHLKEAFAKLQHEEYMLTNPAYKEHYEKIMELNEQRKLMRKKL